MALRQSFACIHVGRGVAPRSPQMVSSRHLPSIRALRAGGKAAATLIDAGNIDTFGGLRVSIQCEFVQISKATASPSWAVTAICQEPGYVFPDVLSGTQMSPTQIDLVSVRPADDESEATGNSGSYHLCEGVALP